MGTEQGQQAPQWQYRRIPVGNGFKVFKGEHPAFGFTVPTVADAELATKELNAYEAELAQLRPKAALEKDMAEYIQCHQGWEPCDPKCSTDLLARHDALSTPAPAEFICPDCRVERSDYEGPMKHLRTCPNCGSSESPTKPTSATRSKAFEDNLRIQDALGASTYDMPATTTEAENA